jgi:hypothetical protein
LGRGLAQRASPKGSKAALLFGRMSLGGELPHVEHMAVVIEELTLFLLIPQDLYQGIPERFVGRILILLAFLLEKLAQFPDFLPELQGVKHLPVFDGRPQELQQDVVEILQSDDLGQTVFNAPFAGAEVATLRQMGGWFFTPCLGHVAQTEVHLQLVFYGILWHFQKRVEDWRMG